MAEWISVKDRLPGDYQMVIGYTPSDGYMFVGDCVSGKGWTQWRIFTALRSTKIVKKKVTHWMPLPEPPEKGK